MLDRCKEETKYIIRNGCNEADEVFFQTAKGRERRLKQVGIDITVPCIRGIPVINDEDAAWTTRAMMGLRTKMSDAKDKKW